jgi:hypothetical protein
LTLPGSSQPLVEATGLFVAVPDFFAPGGAGAIDPDADSWSSHTGPES